MKSTIERLFIIFTFTINIIAVCSSSSLPEDYVTDNEEQLARLKRENFLESILKHLPFFRDTSEQVNEDKETENKDQEPKKSEAKSEEKIIPLMSSIVTSSSFASYQIQSIKLSSQINITQSTLPFNNTLKSAHSSSASSLNKTAIVNQTTSARPFISTTSTISAFSKSTTVLLTSSLIFKDSVSRSNRTETASILNFPVSSMLFSTVAFPSPSTPAPHFSSSAMDTAPLTSMPLQTVFSSSLINSSSVVPKTQVAFDRHSSSFSAKSSSTESVNLKEEEKRMPVLPDETGYGDKSYNPPGIQNVKEVSFVYLNILLPVVSGISGALLITFSIMLFRCCRRRKLKKVRYFGGKPSSDFVRLDKMSLLTDTSDEEDFD